MNINQLNSSLPEFTEAQRLYIVLGGGVDSGYTSDRALAASSLYRESLNRGEEPFVIVSGLPQEIRSMSEIMRLSGVKIQSICPDPAKNSIETVAHVAQIPGVDRLKRLDFVTNAFHLKRALYLANMALFRVVSVVPIDNKFSSRSLAIKTVAKEEVALMGYKLAFSLSGVKQGQPDQMLEAYNRYLANPFSFVKGIMGKSDPAYKQNVRP